jgi:hypothetical protein
MSGLSSYFSRPCFHLPILGSRPVIRRHPDEVKNWLGVPDFRDQRCTSSVSPHTDHEGRERHSDPSRPFMLCNVAIPPTAGRSNWAF